MGSGAENPDGNSQYFLSCRILANPPTPLVTESQVAIASSHVPET